MSISNKVFTKVTVTRTTVFDTLMQLMTNSGWTLLNGGADLVNSYIFSSTGNDGNKKILLQMSPYDGASGAGTELYDIRNKNRATVGSSGAFRLLKSYDTATKAGVPYGSTISSWRALPFIHTRRGDDAYTLSSNLYIFVPADQVFNLWYYIDKEQIIYYLDVPRTMTGYAPMLMFIGIPEERFLNESFTDVPTAFVSFCTGSGAVSEGNSSSVLTAQRPVAHTPPATEWFYDKSYPLSIPRLPSVDRQFQLSEVICGSPLVGFRYRLGGFLIGKHNVDEVADGDTLTVESGGTVYKYRYGVTSPGYANWTSMPSGFNSVAFRIQ